MRTREDFNKWWYCQVVGSWYLYGFSLFLRLCEELGEAPDCRQGAD